MATDHAPSVHTLVSLLEVRSTVEDAVSAEASAFSYDEDLVPKAAAAAAERVGGEGQAAAAADSASRLMAGLGIAAGRCSRCPLFRARYSKGIIKEHTLFRLWLWFPFPSCPLRHFTLVLNVTGLQ